MKKLLAACTLAILAAGSSAMAQTYSNPSVGPRIFLNDAVGQQVYDVQGMSVGTIRGVTDETGQASAIVTTGKAGPGNKNVLIIAAELQPRDGGGWLSTLPASVILDMPPYIPGRMLPLNGPG